MPKQTLTTIIGANMAVEDGKVQDGEGGETDVRILVILDGPDRIHVPMLQVNADQLADALRGDGVEIARSLPRMAIPKG